MNVSNPGHDSYVLHLQQQQQQSEIGPDEDDNMFERSDIEEETGETDDPTSETEVI